MKGPVHRWLAWLVAGLGILAATQVRADIVVEEIDDQQILDPTDNYTFHEVLTAGTTITNGNFFTIYDIPGLALGAPATAPPGWVASIQLLGNTPAGLTPTDSNSIYNITYTWTSASTISVPTGLPQIDLGPFTLQVVTAVEPTLPGSYIWTSQSTGANGGPVPQQGSTAITFLAPSTPEPASLLLVGLGFPVALLAFRRRKMLASGKGPLLD